MDDAATLADTEDLGTGTPSSGDGALGSTIYMKGRRYHAIGCSYEMDEVEVFAGSIFSALETPSLATRARRDREALLAERLLRESGAGLVLQENVIFQSFSGAAQAVAGTKINGWRAWRSVYRNEWLEWEEEL